MKTRASTAALLLPLAVGVTGCSGFARSSPPQPSLASAALAKAIGKLEASKTLRATFNMTLIGQHPNPVSTARISQSGTYLYRAPDTLYVYSLNLVEALNCHLRQPVAIITGTSQYLERSAGPSCGGYSHQELNLGHTMTPAQARIFQPLIDAIKAQEVWRAGNVYRYYFRTVFEKWVYTERGSITVFHGALRSVSSKFVIQPPPSQHSGPSTGDLTVVYSQPNAPVAEVKIPAGNPPAPSS